MKYFLELGAANFQHGKVDFEHALNIVGKTHLKGAISVQNNTLLFQLLEKETKQNNLDLSEICSEVRMSVIHSAFDRTYIVTHDQE